VSQPEDLLLEKYLDYGGSMSCLTLRKDSGSSLPTYIEGIGVLGWFLLGQWKKSAVGVKQACEVVCPAGWGFT